MSLFNMAKQVYKNYQLHRTLPKLSGNMQLDLIVDVFNKVGYVNQAHLRPLSKYVNFAPVVDERIMDRPHHLNIKRFYEKTRSGFFEQAYSPVLKSDWPLMISEAEMPNLKYIKQFDDTYFAGCQRMSHKLYGCTHELLVPVWLDHCYGLRFDVYISNQTPDQIMGLNGTQKQSVTGGQLLFQLNISKEYLMNMKESHRFHNDFVKYMMDYFDYVKITGGSNNVMSINLKENMSTISGLAVESGNYIVRQNLNIARNLIFRERPLLEANSLITNTFMDYKMITTQLINFNLCFNFNKILDSMVIRNGSTFERSRIYVKVNYIQALKDDPNQTYFDEPNFETRQGYQWVELPLADFYTNHHYIPKQRIDAKTSTGFTDSYNDLINYPRNVLDYKRDFECTDMIHQNKMSQSICHWYYADQPEDMLFNVYNGFAAYAADGSEYSHGYGASVDPNDTIYDESLDNTIWAGIPHIHSDQTTMNILNAPYNYVQSGYFKDASNFIGGIKFTYDEASAGYNPNSGKAAPSAVYFATATTPRESGRFAWWTAQSNVLGDLHTIAILTDRASSPENLNDLPKTQGDEVSQKDIRRDWHLHSDMDNRYMIRKSSNARDRCMLRAYYDPTGKYLKEGEYLWVNESDVMANATISTKDNRILVDGEHVFAGNGPGARGTDISTDTYNGVITLSMLMRIGGTGETDTSYRNEDNANGLFVTFLRTPFNKNEPPKPNDPLFVIFETKRSDRTTPVGKNIIYKKSDPSAIVLGNIKQSLTDYYVKYAPMVEMINHIKDVEGDKVYVNLPDLPDMDDLNIITNIVNNIESPQVIYFNNSIDPRQDITLSFNAKEHTYYKLDNYNDYVWRYSGKIKPAIYPIVIPATGRKRVERTGAALTYNSWYGRNFIWYKEPLFALGQVTPPNLARYINKGIAPKYPSLDFEVVNPMVNPGDEYPNLHGDLIYDEIPAMYLGQTFSVHDSGALMGRMDFTPLDFGFEDTDPGHSYSFAISVLGRPHTDFNLQMNENGDYINKNENGVIRPHPIPCKWWENVYYLKSAREAIKTHKFDTRNLLNQSSNNIGYWLYANEYDSYEWAEFKWFNTSYIVTLPLSYLMEGEVIDNDKATLEDLFVTKLLDSIKADSKYPNLYDKALIRASYDFEYDLQKINPDPKHLPNEPLYKYKYIVTATLK